jgi:glycosyltransferase involved in cell wall biosynthesis
MHWEQPILILHNYYQLPGGEDHVFDAESRLLRSYGHKVVHFTLSNENIQFMSRLTLAKATLWNRATYLKVKDLIRHERPWIAHFHNTFPLISPSAYDACHEYGIPVIQTLHNFRLLCPGALLFRKGRVCESCLRKMVPWPALMQACYRGSLLATCAVCGMLSLHKAMKTWIRKVDCYIALTQFARNKFIQGGLPASKITVKPNCLDLEPSASSETPEGAIFVGRFSSEKGIRTLLRAWRLVKEIPLKMVGDGPLLTEIEQFVSREPLRNVELLKWMKRKEVLELMQRSRFLVFPSELYENFPMTLLEAFACARPVIASRRGAMEEIVQNGKTGLHFNPSDAGDLAAKVQWAWSHPDEMIRMGRRARREYERRYTGKANYERLMKIYHTAVANGSPENIPSP